MVLDSEDGEMSRRNDLLISLVEQHKHLVVHIKRAPYEVYVGRNSAGRPSDADPECPWGNPFSTNEAKHKLQTDIQTRTKQYLNWLLASPAMVTRVRAELPGQVLGCWCSPKYCHGWVLAALANCSARECEALCAPCMDREASGFDQIEGRSPYAAAVAHICADDGPSAKGGGKGKPREKGKGRGKGKGRKPSA